MGDNLSKAGVVVVSDTAPWVQHADLILKIVSRFHSQPERHEEIRPLSERDWKSLQRFLLDNVPGMKAFSEQISESLKQHIAVYMPQVGIADYSASERAILAYAACLCFGNPTPTDSKQVIWDVKARIKESTYITTFSETDNEAAYHTDTQYFPVPERLFALYCIRPARCHGGYSSILDARALREDLRRDHPRLFEALARREFPFRVPSAFASTLDPGVADVTLAPVFSSDVFMRYRHDMLEKGFKCVPELRDGEAQWAIDQLEIMLKKSPHQAEFFMEEDSMVFVDNHRALHARTAFSDHERHLVRIRMRTEDQKTNNGKARLIQRQVEVAQPVHS